MIENFMIMILLNKEIIIFLNNKILIMDNFSLFDSTKELIINFRSLIN
jgi:hypothetical protein